MTIKLPSALQKKEETHDQFKKKVLANTYLAPLYHSAWRLLYAKQEDEI